jgi:hypothetical protein
MATKAAWSTNTLDPQKILLDVKNPRIEVDENASQDEIRRKLLDFEEVLDLARSIEKSQGLFYGERIITVIERGKQVVLEGNRRVAACQMLLNPTIVPASYKLRFPIVSASTKAQIRRLQADVAPNRETAEPILTKRHTERGVKPWSPVAKMRRAVRLLDRSSIEQAAQVLGTSSAQVKKLIRPYRLLKYAIDLKIWTPDERKALEDEKLKTNPYTRFFTLGKTKEILQAQFDENENIVSGLPAKVFKEEMTRIARDFLIPDPSTGRPRCDTRTDPSIYFSSFINSPTGKGAAGPKQPATPNTVGSAPNNASSQAGSGGAARPKTPKASVFFENLECHVRDDKLIKLTQEIRDINHDRRPIAASLLTRALFECALVYKLQTMKRWKELIRAEGKDPGLAEIIKFCGNFDNGVFVENNICKALKSHTTVQAKNYLDAMTHLKYQEADSRTLESVANNLRQVIQYILAGN